MSNHEQEKDIDWSNLKEELAAKGLARDQIEQMIKLVVSGRAVEYHSGKVTDLGKTPIPKPKGKG